MRRFVIFPDNISALTVLAQPALDLHILMEDRREAKRARQACLNCRRKKSRCSGEKPVCAFCARLGQRCTWDGHEDRSPESFTESRGTSATAAVHHDSDLAARIALLESRLNFLDAENAFRLFSSLPGPGNPAEQEVAQQSYDQQNVLTDQVEDLRIDFLSLPYPELLRSLVDVYFERCHNQPYAYFHQESFRYDYDSGVLPDYLLYALAATACRFSDHDFYRNKWSDAIDSYAQASFTQILERYFSDADSLQVDMIVALSMLATVEFAAGRPKLGWIKLALSTRFAQSLRLNEEPDPQLPLLEQEERRRVFWSVYLLDVLMSVGPNRPPSLLDEDCTVRLPCDENFFNEGTAFNKRIPVNSMPTLTEVQEDASIDLPPLNSFALTILMASALGRFLRFSLKRTLNKARVLWDPRSKYYEVHSILLRYESQSPCAFTPVIEVIHKLPTLGPQPPSKVSHTVFAHVLYHLNQSLLNHPFILYRFFHNYAAPIPLSFVQEALQRCHQHATSLIELLTNLETHCPLSHASFYGYCVMAEGLILRMYERNNDKNIADAASRRVREALNFLQRKPIRWSHVGHMGTLLSSFELDASIARVLTDPASLARKVDVPHGTMLWQLLDYAWAPQNKPPSAIRSSLAIADLLSETAPEEANNPTGSSCDSAYTPIVLFDSRDSLPSSYARMLGEDM
ncbi:hypothetical protein PV08_06329 [Exophiala spinifera]|uniref:Zn(2)-C6 fungal-type domain-containing protein n=1 Tax=Exophiala spinifera TaxID=91928 RepID=A0A0D2BB85_9EURO|nr:uncharacterized protein PV08_06329 [Exophiala spinifera]KIW16278.1 hypothetical protein PV08_06329 [Exophiala spinifera]